MSMTQEEIKYELEHSWDDACEILYSVLNTELPNIINRLESVKDRLISGNNKDIWNDDFEEEDYAVYCNKLKKIVHEDLHWTECAGTNSTHKGLDKRVSICPIDNIYDN